MNLPSRAQAGALDHRVRSLLISFFVLVPGLVLAQASGTEAIEEAVIDLTTLLTVVGIGIVSIAIMVAGYKMIFSSARLSDVANILIGGTLAGGATALAGWVFA